MPGVRHRQGATPKKPILQNEEALLAGKFELPLKDLYDDRHGPS